jgi:hypothetical protein
MEPWMIGVIAGLAGFFAVVASRRRAKKEGYDQVLPLLQQRGAMTVPELLEALGKKGFTAQGTLVMELGALVREGTVIEHPLPAGTPQLQKVKVRKYAAK